VEYTTEEREVVVAKVLAGLADGIPLAELCRGEGMPDRVTVYRWKAEDADLAQRIACAREAGFDAIADECFDIADDGSNDYHERKRQDGSSEEVFNSEHVQRSKLRIDTRLKLLAKWDPKRYGDRTLLGSDPENPLPPGFAVNLVKSGNAPG
jgi:hypothetical protein